jgi:predicted phosphodiesterase
MDQREYTENTPNTENTPENKRGLALAAFQAVIVVLAIIMSMTLFGSTSYQVKGISLEAFVKPSLNGQTYIKLPPLGELSANTHRGPIDFFLELTEIHPTIIEEELTTADSQDKWIGSLQSEAKKHLALFLLKQILIGAAGATLIYQILFRPKVKNLLAVFLGTLLIATSVIGYCAATFNTEGFRQPQYRGVVAAGPEVLQLSNKFYDGFMNFRDKTDEVVKSINTLFTNLEGLTVLAEPGDEELKILIVSDISNNPVGIQLVQTLAGTFDVDMIIDGGDLTDFGSPLETKAFERIGNLGVPYLFAPGNHDSPEVLAFLHQFSNVSILESAVVNSGGLSVLGEPDPWSFGSSVYSNDEAEIDQVLSQQAEKLKASLEANPETDIAVIHNPKYSEELEGLVPVVISGHTHRVSVKRTTDTLYLNPGTTGASGFRGLQTQEMEYSALILHFGRNTREQAVVDIIRYDPLSSSINLERRLI